MGRYIVLPRESQTDRYKQRDVRLDILSRKAQMEEVRSLRSRDPVNRAVREWIGRCDPEAVTCLTTSKTDMPILSVEVVEMSDRYAERMRREIPDILVIEDTPLDPILPGQSASSPNQSSAEADLWHLQAIGLQQARSQGFTGRGSGVTVAVLDTGIDASHPEIAGKVSSAWELDKMAGQLNLVHPSEDTDGHGTHVAGLICGKQVGVAPDAKLASVLLLPGGKGNESDFILALNSIIGQKELAEEVVIVNVSAGIRSYSLGMHVAIRDLRRVGKLVIAAIGNEGQNIAWWPGAYMETLGVGASDRDKNVAKSSGGDENVNNQGYSKPDLVAPGVGIYSCIKGGGYATKNGTSMAAAIVSGIAALILESRPTITDR